MKRILLVLLLLPVQVFAQTGIPNFLHRPMQQVGTQLAQQHLSFDTSFSYPPEGPTVAYIAYAPYSVNGVPGVLLVHGRDTVSSIDWYSRAVDVDTDLNWVISRHPTGQFSQTARSMQNRIVSPEEFNALVSQCALAFGESGKRTDSMVTWRGCRSICSANGVVRLSLSEPIDPRTLQATRYSYDKSVEVRAMISPGLRGLRRLQVLANLKGKYTAMHSSADSSLMVFAPYDFHGIAGVLKTGFDNAGICTGLSWGSSDPISAITPTWDTSSQFAHIVRSFDDALVTEKQYNALREMVGLPKLDQTYGLRLLAYYPTRQTLWYEAGRLEYKEEKSLYPMRPGMYLSGCEPTMDVVTGR